MYIQRRGPITDPGGTTTDREKHERMSSLTGIKRAKQEIAAYMVESRDIL